MTQLYLGADLSDPERQGITPGFELPPGTEILLGYVGAKDLAGQPDTPHIWTLDDWNMYLQPGSNLYGGPQLRPMPIYTHNYPGNPAEDAANAIDAMADFAWALNRGRIIWWDAETFIDFAYTTELNLQVRAKGARLGKYGSLDTINQNPPVDGGSWVADWTGIKPGQLPPDRVGWQYASGAMASGPWDLSVFSRWVYGNAGRGVRRLVP